MDQDTGSENLNRRRFMGVSLAGGALFGGAALGLIPNTAQAGFDPRLPEKFRDPEWNRDAYARLLGHLDFGEQKHGWYEGVVHGVRPNEPIRPLMRFEGYSAARLIDNGDGSYQNCCGKLSSTRTSKPMRS